MEQFLTLINDIGGVRREADVRFIHGEQRPGLGTEVDAVEAGQREILSEEAHRTSDDRVVIWKRTGEHGHLATGHVFQNFLPVPMMFDLGDPRIWRN